MFNANWLLLSKLLELHMFAAVIETVVSFEWPPPGVKRVKEREDPLR